MKTKIIITAMFLSSISSSSFAQLPVAQKEKNNYKWGVTLGVNSAQDQLGITGSAVLDNTGSVFTNNVGTIKNDKSFSIGGLFKYSINTNYTIRLGIGLTQINKEENVNTTQSNTYYNQENTDKQNMRRYDIGIQQNIKKDFFDLYGGLMLSYLNYGKIDLYSYNSGTDLSTNAIISTSTREFLIPGGFAAGIGGFFGSCLYLNKHFSIGTEVSWAYCYVKMGGMLTDVTIQSIPSPLQITSYAYEESYKGFRFTKLIPSINANINF